jgi:hypothetical protein
MATVATALAQQTRPMTPPDVGRKFNADGDVVQFAGNTVICHLEQQGEKAACFNALLDIYRDAISHPFMRKVTLLPPSSYHMTVFGAANNAERVAGLWPRNVPLDLPIAECHKIIADRLRTFKTNVSLPIKMRVDLAEPGPEERPLTLRLLPLDEAENKRLRMLRDRLSDATGVRTPGHDAYRFHITLGYLFEWLEPSENEAFRSTLRQWCEMVATRVPVIELGAPEFCTFEDMFAFHRQFYLS